jgi:hypothetical protein
MSSVTPSTAVTAPNAFVSPCNRSIGSVMVVITDHDANPMCCWREDRKSIR